ncbi:FecR family protein [Larkinella soli]|uniref:FecR family protein n=1 Tax=Larkinella soli TaxID=1770527 RepID=UPI000FFCB0D2|nr:FecR domain-containing protein [Larkinella soli]
MQRSRADYLINKLISNELSKAELDELLEGLANDDSLKEYSDILERYFHSLMAEETTDTPADPAPSPEAEPLPERPGLFRRFFSDYGRLAATVALVLALGAGWYAFIDRPGNARLTGRISATTPHDAFARKEAVPRGSRKNVQLSDGSRVRINSASRLSFPERFGRNERKLALNGEAYFDVKRDPARPFTIALDDLKVKVLGTSFNIRSYAEDDEIVITVHSGKVSVDIAGRPESPVILTKNQQLTFHKKTDQYQITSVDAGQESIWVDGALQFGNTPLEQVERTLERWYNVEVVIQDSTMYGSSFTGKHRNESLPAILESLCFAMNARYEIDGRTVTISR